MTSSGEDNARAVLEAIGFEAYRQNRIYGYQLPMLLGIPSLYESNTIVALLRLLRGEGSQPL